MKDVCRYVGWTMLIFSVVLLYGSRDANDGITAFILVGMLVSSVIMLIYGYHKRIKPVRLAKDIIVINNVAYPPSSFETINGLIINGQTERAVKELQWLINVSEPEAHDIVKKWDEYCG